MIGWITDPHLGHLAHRTDPWKYCTDLANKFPEVESWLLTGDIAEARVITSFLRSFQEAVGKPVSFVTGNHDYYGSSFNEVDSELWALNRDSKDITWLRASDPIPFGDGFLVGNSGWYDGLYGNPGTSVMLNDFVHIADQVQGYMDRDFLLEVARSRAKGLAENLSEQLEEATEKSDRIVVATHVPPFKEAAWYRHEPSNDDFLPWFSSKTTGRVLDIFAESHPKTQFLVVCGHTHGSGKYIRRDNLTIYTGASQYGFPGVSGLIDPKSWDVLTNDFRVIFGKH